LGTKQGCLRRRKVVCGKTRLVRGDARLFATEQGYPWQNWWQRPESEPGQRPEREPPPASGLMPRSVALPAVEGEDLDLPVRRSGRRAVGNAKRFPRGVGGCRVGGVGAAAFHTPADRRPGEKGVRGKRGEISTALPWRRTQGHPPLQDVPASS